MAVSRFANLPEYTPFDPYVPTSADMEGKVRELQVNDLMAKKAIDDDLHNKLGETGQLLAKFKPNQFFNIQHESGDVTPTASRLYPAYQQKVQEFYDTQQALLSKHSDNLSTPEAQRDFQKFQGYTSQLVSELADIKASDEALTKSEEARAKAIAENTGGNIDGSFRTYNDEILRNYGIDSPMGNVYNKAAILPQKALDRNKHITDYVGDKLIRQLSSERLIDPSITTISQLIPAIREGKVSQKTKTRTREALGVLLDNYLNEYAPNIQNHALQRVRDAKMLQGKDIPYEQAYKSVLKEVKDDFMQNIIDDRSFGIDASTKTLDIDQARATGKGAFNTTRDISIIENPLMDSNVKPEVFDLDSKGNLKTEYTTTEMRTVKDEFGVRDKVPTKITRTLTASTPQEYSKLLYNNEAFRNVLNAEGVNIVGDVKQSDIPRIQKALKDNKERVYNNLQLATNGYDAVQLNVPKLDQTMTNQINATTLRFNKDATLPKDLPQKDTKTGSMDGSTFNEWLSSKYNVKVQTDNILAATGQLGKPVGLKRTVLYQDEKGGTTKRLDIYQDSPFKDINDNPDYNALNEITKYTSSGKDASQVKIPTNKGEYIFELKRTPNNRNKTYDYTGKVYDPITNTWSDYQDFKKATTVGILLDVLKNSEGVGRSFTKDDIGQVENMYNSNNLEPQE